ncbi:hypothetical protein ACFYWY_38125, partial [Streptomyces sp. NPDC002870]
MNSLFVQVLSLCGRRGLVDLSAVAVDGSPMEANASRDANQRLQRLEEAISQCEKEIHALMEDLVDHALSVEADALAGCGWTANSTCPPSSTSPRPRGSTCCSAPAR